MSPRVRSSLALIGLLFGPALIIMGVRSLAGGRAAESWVPVRAIVTESHVAVAGVRDRSFTPVLRYQYEHGGGT